MFDLEFVKSVFNDKIIYRFDEGGDRGQSLRFHREVVAYLCEYD